MFVAELLETDAGFDVSGFLRDLASITASVLTVILVIDRTTIIDRIDNKRRARRVADVGRRSLARSCNALTPTSDV